MIAAVCTLIFAVAMNEGQLKLGEAEIAAGSQLQNAADAQVSATNLKVAAGGLLIGHESQVTGHRGKLGDGGIAQGLTAMGHEGGPVDLRQEDLPHLDEEEPEGNEGE